MIRRKMGFAIVILAGSAPLLTIASTIAIADWPASLPEIYLPSERITDDSLDMLGGVAGSLSSLATAVIVGLALILHDMRRQLRRSGGAFILGTASAMCAASSIYAGYSFQIALAEQLILFRPDLDRIRSRLDWQGMALVFAVSFLAALVAVYVLANIRREDAAT